MAMNCTTISPTAAYYYPTLCGHCHQPGSVSSPLKRCSGCDCFYYCSRDHQKQHRREHKTLCDHLAKHKKDGKPVFGGFTGKTRPEMMRPLFQEFQVYSLLKSKTEPIFLNPPVCRKTGCLAPVGVGPGGLVSCPDCLAVTWCSSLHRAEARQHHEEFCLDLKLARAADSLEDKHGPLITIPVMPKFLDKKYKGDSETMIEYLPPLLILITMVHGSRALKDYEVEDCDNSTLHFIFASDLLSGPLTVLEAARKWTPDLAVKETLKVHISGAYEYDFWCPNKWEEIAHRLPALKHLDIRFIGPHLPQASSDLKDKIIQPVEKELCDECSPLGRVITHGFYRMSQQQFRELEDYSPPDIVLVQNCGFSEFKTESMGFYAGWEEGMGSLLHQNGAPVIFTSHSKSEALRDLKRFQDYCGQEVEVLVNCQENRMRSYRPRRTPASLEEEKDVHYSNYYLNIVRLKC